MKHVFLVSAAFGALIPQGASAQDTYYWPAPTPASANTRMVEFPMGTPLALITRTEVNTKQTKPGDRVYLEVAESLSYRGQIVVPVGAPAVAEVVRSERNGHFGKNGTIELRLLQVQTPSGPVRLAGRLEHNGKNAAIWSIGAMVLTGGVGWGLIHGTSGYIRHGTAVAAYLAEPLLFMPQTPQPEAVSAVQPEHARSLPAHFDPGVFGGNGPGLSQR